jgi:hypothetical protein
VTEYTIFPREDVDDDIFARLYITIHVPGPRFGREKGGNLSHYRIAANHLQLCWLREEGTAWQICVKCNQSYVFTLAKDFDEYFRKVVSLYLSVLCKKNDQRPFAEVKFFS